MFDELEAEAAFIQKLTRILAEEAPPSLMHVTLKFHKRSRGIRIVMGVATGLSKRLLEVLVIVLRCQPIGGKEVAAQIGKGLFTSGVRNDLSELQYRGFITSQNSGYVQTMAVSETLGIR